MKKLFFVGLILLLASTIVLSAPFLVYKDCVVIDVGNQKILEPVEHDLTQPPGFYKYFKPEFRPKPIPGLKPEINLSIMTGLPLDTWECDD